jgi:hypothetical protein
MHLKEIACRCGRRAIAVTARALWRRCGNGVKRFGLCILSKAFDRATRSAFAQVDCIDIGSGEQLNCLSIIKA